MFDKYDDANVFNKIINGILPCNKVYEDEKILAFQDINPVAPIHLLVTPKEKYISFNDFIEGSCDVLHFFLTIKKIANNHCPKGYRLVTNYGKDSGQIIPHFHVHIISGKKLGNIA